MLRPDPPQVPRRIILVSTEPELSSDADDVEDLARHVREVRVAGFFAFAVDVELEEGGGEEEDRGRWAGGGWGMRRRLELGGAGAGRRGCC